MAKFQLASLFERWTPSAELVAYPSVEASLDAVRAGKKGMSRFTFPAGGPEHRKLLRLAFARDLVVVLENHDVVFVVRPAELWRVPAFMTLWNTALVDGTWSNAAENQMSSLLGYTAKQRERWLERHRQWQAAWGCATVYALLGATQRAAVATLGDRTFGPVDELAGVTLFVCPNGVLKTTALRLVPKGTTLARVGLDWKMFEKLFGTKPSHGLAVRSATLSKRQVIATNAALKSKLQFFDRRGWT
jgi:hypothetical protein